MIDRYHTTQRVTCPTCGWSYNVTDGKPETCPGCERNKGMADLTRVIAQGERERAQQKGETMETNEPPTEQQSTPDREPQEVAELDPPMMVIANNAWTVGQTSPDTLLVDSEHPITLPQARKLALALDRVIEYMEG